MRPQLIGEHTQVFSPTLAELNPQPCNTRTPTVCKHPTATQGQRSAQVVEPSSSTPPGKHPDSVRVLVPLVARFPATRLSGVPSPDQIESRFPLQIKHLRRLCIP